MPHDFGPRLPAREGTGAAMCPMTLSSPRASEIKKGSAGLGMQLGSRVPMSCLRVTKAPSPNKRYKMCGHADTVQRRPY
jgi:hypothetical protein